MPQPTFTQLNIKVYFFFGSDTDPKKKRPSVTQRLARKVKEKVGLSPSKKIGRQNQLSGRLRPRVLLKDVLRDK